MSQVEGVLQEDWDDAGWAGEAPASSGSPAAAPPGVPVLVADRASLVSAAPPTGPAGLLLGRGEDPWPVALALFRPRPTRLVVADLALARVVAFRAMAVGARVAVATTRPEGWAPLLTTAGDGRHRVQVVSGATRAAEGASPHSPLLLVQDRLVQERARVARPGGGGRGAARPDAVRLDAGGPWRCLLTVLRGTGPEAAAVLDAADAALLAADQVELLRQAGERLRVLPTGTPDARAGGHLLLVRGEGVRRLQVEPTELERRMDLR
ncbi:hypothetical protein EV189_2161 [Motilibacter rhizosphaerae]|uniref:Uncharacterized protein n=1 Tax=Motilibacter rhizosphaerae TaxID=598652 RepID=A0A4Q7NT79_9ACTN|nr:hypothetical protein [Motilibacter rhizosphaerae]RZS90376.1 hypothetical protein EV189_2161 [Motilibacter rhizosphaerae]